MSRRAALVGCLFVLLAAWTTISARAQDPFGKEVDDDPFAAPAELGAASDENPFAEAPNDRRIGARPPAKKAADKGLEQPVHPLPGRANDPTVKSETRVRAALRDPTRMEFTEMPLIDAMAFLKDYHGIEIQLDTRALEDIGVGSDTPVTRNLNGISLDAALRLMLDDIDLTHIVRNGVLVVTSKDKAQSLLELRVYNVGQAIGHDVSAEEAGTMLNELSGYTPTKSGGPSDTRLQVVPFKDLLIIRASQHDHEQLVELFDELKAKLVRIERQSRRAAVVGHAQSHLLTAPLKCLPAGGHVPP